MEVLSRRIEADGPEALPSNRDKPFCITESRRNADINLRRSWVSPCVDEINHDVPQNGYSAEAEDRRSGRTMASRGARVCPQS